MGGDNAPDANLLGAFLAYKELSSNEIWLTDGFHQIK